MHMVAKQLRRWRIQDTFLSELDYYITAYW